MVEICALASGSNGNCYYIGNEEEAILVDIGISNRMLKKRMELVGLSMKKVKAVFVTHEHTDHVKGMRVVSEMNGLKSYITRKTWAKSRNDYRSPSAVFFHPGDVLTIGNIKVHSFSKKHDAEDPVSFRVEVNGINVAVLTDLGTLCPVIKGHLELCHAAFLEANYDDQMLQNGHYPLYLKKRVASDYGHLSNKQALEVVQELHGSPLKTLILSHISKDNNKVELALESFSPLSDTHLIVAASRLGPSSLIEIK